MTIRELYEWAVEHGCEDFTVWCGGGLDREVAPEEIGVSEQWEQVTL